MSHGPQTVPPPTAPPLYCREFGRGPAPVVAVHGFGATVATWGPLAEHLGDEATLHAFDLKGFGLSPKPRDRAYSIADQAELILECIERLGLERFSLLGHSMGGAVCLFAAIRLLERGDLPRLTSLLLVGAAGYPQALPFFIRIPGLPLIGPLLQALTPARLAISVAMRTCYASADRIRPELIDAYAEPLRSAEGRFGLRSVSRYMVPDNPQQYLARYPELDVPTLVITGSAERVIDRSVAPRLARELPRATLHTLDEAGHNAHEEQPQIVAGLIRPYLQIQNHDSGEDASS